MCCILSVGPLLVLRTLKHKSKVLAAAAHKRSRFQLESRDGLGSSIVCRTDLEAALTLQERQETCAAAAFTFVTVVTAGTVVPVVTGVPVVTVVTVVPVVPVVEAEVWQ